MPGTGLLKESPVCRKALALISAWSAWEPGRRADPWLIDPREAGWNALAPLTA